MLDAMYTAYNHKEKDNWKVYWFKVPTHRGTDQGYVGVTNMTLFGLGFRYATELFEAFDPNHKRSIRRVHQFLQQYSKTVTCEFIAEGLTEEEAYNLEKKLRPHKNEGEHFSIYNWNVNKGGKGKKK